jgi:hypothetical protein
MLLPIWTFIAVLSVVSSLPTQEQPHLLVKCEIRNDLQRKFILDQVAFNGLDMWDHSLPTGAGRVTLLATPVQLREIQRQLICTKATNVQDLEKELEKASNANGGKTGGFITDGTRFKKNFFADYRSYQAIEDKLKSFKNPKLDLLIEQIAHSHENRNISVIRMTPADRTPMRKIWVSCGQHAREWIAPASCMYLVDQMVQKYGVDTRVTKMLNTFELLVAPLVNPDGYEFSRTTYRYWRKNRRNNGKGIFGVDLNRNWASRWGEIGINR